MYGRRTLLRGNPARVSSLEGVQMDIPELRMKPSSHSERG